MDTYQALADANRRKIIELIAIKGHLTATDISSNFNISAPAISQHLKVLREAKLVDMEKRAQQRIYSINPLTISEIEQWIGRLKKKWEEKFSRLDKLLEIEKRKKAR
jgi:DNA-binding transcriptional ArsR family regulator